MIIDETLIEKICVKGGRFYELQIHDTTITDTLTRENFCIFFDYKKLTNKKSHLKKSTFSTFFIDAKCKYVEKDIFYKVREYNQDNIKVIVLFAIDDNCDLIFFEKFDFINTSKYKLGYYEVVHQFNMLTLSINTIMKKYITNPIYIGAYDDNDESDNAKRLYDNINDHIGTRHKFYNISIYTNEYIGGSISLSNVSILDKGLLKDINHPKHSDFNDTMIFKGSSLHGETSYSINKFMDEYPNVSCIFTLMKRETPVVGYIQNFITENPNARSDYNSVNKHLIRRLSNMIGIENKELVKNIDLNETYNANPYCMANAASSDVWRSREKDKF